MVTRRAIIAAIGGSACLHPRPCLKEENIDELARMQFKKGRSDKLAPPQPKHQHSHKPCSALCCRLRVLLLLMVHAGCTASFVRVQSSTHDGGIRWGSGVSFGGDIEMKDSDRNGREEDLHIHNNVITEDVQEDANGRVSKNFLKRPGIWLREAGSNNDQLQTVASLRTQKVFKPASGDQER